MSALHFNALLTTKDFEAGMAKIRQEIRSASGVAQTEAKAMDSSFASLGAGIATYFSGQALAGLAKEIINIRGEFQKTEVAFSTMLGDSGKAKELMGQMVQLAAKTPFALKDVADGAKQLLAFQVPANEVVDTLTRMGNIAAGLSVPLERVNLVYGQIKALGKLTTQDMKQFMTMGIPLAAELADKFKVTESAIFDMVTEGKVGFKDVQDVLFDMTNEGGMFFNLMESQSKTLSGQWSNLQDSIDQVFNSIGQQNEGLLSSGIEGLTYLVENYQDVVDILTVLIATYGAYRVAIMLTARSQEAAVAPAIIQSFKSLIDVLRGATSAQVAFNAAGNANPWIAITSVVIALGTAIYTYREELAELVGLTEEYTESQKTQIAVNEELANKYSKGLSEQKVKIQELISVIRNEYSTVQQRENAYKKLIAIDERFRGTLDSQFRATYKLGKAFDYVVERMEKFAYAQAQMAVKTKALTENVENQFKAGSLKVQVNDKVSQRNDLENKIANVVNSGGDLSKGGFANKEQYQEARKNLARLRSEIYYLGKEWRKAQDVANSSANQYSNISKTLKLEVKELQKGLVVLEAQYRKGVVSGRKLNEEEKKRLKQQINDQKALINQKLGINDANESEVAVVTNPSDEVSKVVKNKNAEVEKLYGEDTIKGLQQRISKLNEILETSPVGSAKYNEAKAQKSVYEERLKKLTQTFDDEIKEIERQWKVRYALEEKYGKETAKAQFSGLKGDSYYADIKERFSKIDAKLQSGATLSDEEIAQWEKLNLILDNLNGVKDPFTNYKDSLEKSLSSIESGSERIKILEKELYTMTDADIANGKKSYLLEKIESEKEAQKQRYQEFLAAHQSFEERKNAITENYSTLRQKIEADTTLNNEQKKNALEKAAQEEADAYSDAFMTELVNNPQYREAFADLDRQTTSQLKKIRENLQKSLSEEKNLNPEAQARIRQEIENLDRVIGERNPYQKLKNLIEQLGDESISTSQKMKLINEAADTVTGYVNDVKGVVSDVTGALDDLGIEMSDSSKDLVSSINQTLEGFGQMAEGTKQFAEGYLSGDPIKMVAGTIKYISGAIKTITAWTNGDKKKERHIKEWAKEVANLKVQYQELERAMNKALGDDKYKNQQEQIANLERQKILLQQMIKKEEDKKKTDKGKIKDWQQQISDINNQISDIKDNIVNDILQIDVKGLADKIGDALIEGFGRGEDALDSLNKTADEVFRQMVENALKLQLEKQMQPIIDEMLKAMGYSVDSSGKPSGSFDGLTQEERDALKAKIIAATGDYQKAMEQYADLFGPDAANSPNGLKGDIKGITEKTAGALESQINAIRIYQAELMNLHKNNSKIFENQLRVQSQIEINTRPLVQIQKDIAELNSKVKKPLAGLDN